MNKLRTNRDDIWVHPNTVIHLVTETARSCGVEVVSKSRIYAISREAWIASMFLLGLRKIFKERWWLQVNPEENAVEDLFACSFSPILKSASVRHDKNIQVFRRMKYDKGTIFDSIKRKVDHSDLKGCSLVCYIQRRERVEPWKLLNDLISLKPQLNDIWIVGSLSQHKILVVRIFPNPEATVIDLNNIYPEKPMFIYPYPVSKKQAQQEGDYIHPMGKKILLKPNFILEDFN